MNRQKAIFFFDGRDQAALVPDDLTRSRDSDVIITQIHTFSG